MNKVKKITNISKTGILFAFVFLFLFFTIFVSKIGETAGDWYDYNWYHRKEITIDHTKISNTDQSNFPVLINLTDLDLQAYARSDGYDILFTDSTGIAKIPYEREEYTASSGTLIAWVKVATLNYLTDTVIYMYYGNPDATDQQDISGGTWDANFKGVWHSNNASSTTIIDSTANTNTGTKYGMPGPIEVAGKIGKAQSYNGIDEYIRSDPSETLSGSFTVSVWVKVSDSDSSHTIIGTRSPLDSSFDFKFEPDGIIHGDIGEGTVWITNEADVGFSYSYDTWYQITYVVTPTGYKIYIDGNEMTSGSYDENIPLLFDPVHNVFFGQVGYDEEWFKGSIDEIQISDIARSLDWIKTGYNNQNNPGLFYSLGSDTASGETAPNIPVLISPPNETITNDNTPILSANYSDPDVGDIGVTNYRIADSEANCLTGPVIASGTSSETTSNNQDTTWTPESSIGDDGTYYWCAQNDDSVFMSAWTNMGNFTIDTTTSPVLSTLAASSITKTSATLNGLINETGGENIIEHGFTYGTAPDFSSVIITTTEGPFSGVGAIISNISSLTCNITYYFRAYAINSVGTGYGSIVSFSTEACPVSSGSIRRPASFTVPSYIPIPVPVQTNTLELKSQEQVTTIKKSIPTSSAKLSLNLPEEKQNIFDISLEPGQTTSNRPEAAFFIFLFIIVIILGIIGRFILIRLRH